MRLGSLLEEWIKLLEDTAARWPDKDDSAWSYNERASVSVLAGAVWRIGGLAFEEYSTETFARGKRRTRANEVHGRADLYFEVNSREFVVEAKHCRCSAGRNANSPLHVGRLLQEAVMDASLNVPRYGYRRLGAVFAAPKIPVAQGDMLEPLLGRWLERLMALRSHSVAWCFPECAERKGTTTHYSPGVALLLREWRRAA